MPESRRSFLLAIGSLAARAGAGANDGPSPEELARMEGVALAFMSAHAVPGLSVSVARNGNSLYERGFGFADRERNELVVPGHLFRIASVSKPITSVALFRLMEEKRLTLEHLVFGPGGILGNDFAQRQYQRWVEEIRIKHLLTHNPAVGARRTRLSA